ncbi:MAG: hypothetical protein ABIK40_05265 [candidate division WOR-3 bacterium]|uniref:Nucleotidyltransferase family protein n=1 Tax=candidate division WOR-3 bacterium TaxID=2052148 RepID=A0A7V4CHM2_UNCW3
MEIEEVIKKVINILDKLNIPYLLTGALSVVYYGEPRATHDIDLVIQIKEDDITLLMKGFQDNFFIDEESIRNALKERSMFNAVHKDTNFKVDFWILTEDKFNKEMFNRRVKRNILGIEIYLPTPEDVIINKLEWFKMSNIDKHYYDALSVYCVQKDNLDIEYIKNCCKAKSILEIFERMEEEIKKES